MEKYSWNFDGTAEEWRNEPYDTIEDCISAAIEDNRSIIDKYDTVYIGENVPFEPSVDAEQILDQITEDAYQFVGEIVEGWDAYDCKKRDQLQELSDELTKIVSAWMEKHGYYPALSRE